jgi:hypothetical protein
MKVVVVVATMTGCLAADDVAIDSEAQDLYSNPSWYAPNAGTGRVDIPICWQNPSNAPGATAQARAAWREERHRVVDESWGRHARINFTGWVDGCANQAPGIHLYICNSPDAMCPFGHSQTAGAGTGYSGIEGEDAGVRVSPTDPAGVLVHEMGHVLGFLHQQERPDVPAWACGKKEWPNPQPQYYGAYDEDSMMSECSAPTATPWLSLNDVAAIQRSYGRRVPHSLVTLRGNCGAANHADGSGDPAFVWDCDEAYKDQQFVDTVTTDDWSSYGYQLRQFNAAGTDPLCLGPTGTAPGSQVQIRACTQGSQWRFKDVAVKGFGGMCMQVVGTAIQMRECNGSAAQRFTRHTNNQLRYNATQCAGVVNGVLALATCSVNDVNQRFVFLDGGLIFTNGWKCLDVAGPSDAQYLMGIGLPTPGAAVHAFTCNTSMNQRWSLHGPITLDANPERCLTRSSDQNGADLRVRTCDGTEGQRWDYYF